MDTYLDFNEDRVDGIEKVTGRARYTADQRLEKVSYGVFVTSTIARGYIKNMQVQDARNAPGVLGVLYYLNCPSPPGYRPGNKEINKTGFEWRGLKVFANNLVHHYGQPIALVVADTWEKAVKAARLVKTEYQAEPFETDFETLRKDPSKRKKSGEYSRGEKDAWQKAEVSVEAEFHSPIETHNPMEMHATIAHWEAEDRLTVYDKSQGPRNTQVEIARLFGLDEKKVRVITEYVGGAFGASLRSWPHVPAACLAARMVNRPVKLVLNRRQMFSMVGYRPQAWQKIGIGASRDGLLTGITHHAVSNTSRYEDYREGIVNASQFLYACPNVNTRYDLLPLDLNTPTWMRGPGEATGSFALECALDELAYKLQLDPVELRIRNYATVHPVSQLPWSSKYLKECYDKGRELIGWSNRSAQPRSRTENGWLAGYGMGGGVFGAGRGNAQVKAVFKKDGSLTLMSAVSDMGPGTATAMVRIAEESMQMPGSKIRFLLGDTDFPPGPTQGGSMTNSTLGNAVSLACKAVQKNLVDLALRHIPEFAGRTPESLSIRNERIFVSAEPAHGFSLATVLEKAGREQIEILQESGRSPEMAKYAMNSFSVHFVKVLVNPSTGEIKLDKVVATGDGGKIINEKTARSQMIGGAVGGIGMALTEELLVDHSTGKYLNDNLGSYQLPRHKDVPFIETWFPDKPDPVTNAVGSKGVGEIALIGFAAAVANAVFNATGKRIYRLPIKPSDLKEV